ncbi:PIN-like domain-containing protein [Nocardioides sp.]|uniref:PIN-like domain-containing protein n=1 Tax=Nocardioides sp. TaxID=35761 RepID=UPI002CF53EA6|nr:PIN-like domain-containing protein [Nocardioides sp.]HXH78101.1 PIN-like domain-containing protein [Nocardioides sp.]
MRDRFPEFYAPSNDDLKRYVTSGVIIPDANILLGLYRLSTPERDEVFTAMEAVKDRLWLTYQAGLEYQRNRMGVIRQQAAHYEALTRLHGLKTPDEMGAALNGKALPDDVKEAVSPLLTGLHAKLSEAARDYTAEVEAVTARHVVTVEQGQSNDPVRARLDALFAGRVGEAPRAEDRAKSVKEAQRRYAEGIPPGYKDSGKETAESAAGDYLIWAEILDHASTVQDAGKPVLFVTNDAKEDWFERSGGEPTGPQPALVREFAARNTHGYHQVTLSTFLRLTNEHLNTSVLEATIERTSELDDTNGQFERNASVQERRFGEWLATESLTAHPNGLAGLIDPDDVKRAAGLWRFDPEAFKAAAGLGRIDPETFGAAAGLRGIDPETFKAAANLWRIDPDTIRAAQGLGRIDPEMLRAARRAISEVDPETIRRANKARDDAERSWAPEADDADEGENEESPEPTDD